MRSGDDIVGDPLEISVTRHGKRAVVHLSGELDVAGAPRLVSVLDGLAGDVELECSGLGFIDAAGLSAFVRGYQRASDQQATFVVVDPSPVVVRLMRLVELDSVLTIRSSRAG